MDKNKVKEKLKEVINDLLQIDDIKQEDSLIEDLGMDSLDMVELVMYIEEDFDIELPDDGLDNVKTIRDVEKLICEKLNINYE